MACAVSGVSSEDEASLERLRAAVEAGDADRRDGLCYLAAGEWNTGALDEAVSTYRRLLEVEPDSALAHRMIGLALLEAGRPREALASFESARAGDPDDPDTLFGLGVAQYQLGDRDRALETFRATLELRPLHADARLNVGHVLANRRRYAEAAESYRWAHRIDPTRADGYFYEGLMLLLDGRAREATVSWRRGLRAAPEDGPLAGARAAGFVYQQAFDKALQAVQVAKRIGADPAVCALIESMARFGLGEEALARKLRAEALALPAPDGREGLLRGVLDRAAKPLFE